jgi:hypothetical protein
MGEGRGVYRVLDLRETGIDGVNKLSDYQLFK